MKDGPRQDVGALVQQVRDRLEPRSRPQGPTQAATVLMAVEETDADAVAK